MKEHWCWCMKEEEEEYREKKKKESKREEGVKRVDGSSRPRVEVEKERSKKF